jgi:hypothetical protein
LTRINAAAPPIIHVRLPNHQGAPDMTDPLTQTPVLLFALMMVSFIVVVGGLATADLVRKRRD